MSLGHSYTEAESKCWFLRYARSAHLAHVNSALLAIIKLNILNQHWYKDKTIMRNVPLSLRPIEGIAKIADQFDVYFIDIYGVIHDGTSMHPGVLHCLEHLALAGKSVLLLTNTPARSQVIVKRLETIGLSPSLYQHIISSGEVTYRHIVERADSWYARLGEHCYFIGPSHSSLLEGSNFDG